MYKKAKRVKIPKLLNDDDEEEENDDIISSSYSLVENKENISKTCNVPASSEVRRVNSPVDDNEVVEEEIVAVEEVEYEEEENDDIISSSYSLVENKENISKTCNVPASSEVRRVNSPVDDNEVVEEEIVAVEEVEYEGEEGVSTNELKIVKVPADGNCWLHAIGVTIGLAADTLKKFLLATLKNKGSLCFKISGEPIKRWRKELETKNAWGGTKEFRIFSAVLKLKIVEFHKGKELNWKAVPVRTGFEELIDAPYPNGVVGVVYNAHHWDAVQLDQMSLEQKHRVHRIVMDSAKRKSPSTMVKNIKNRKRKRKLVFTPTINRFNVDNS